MRPSLSIKKPEPVPRSTWIITVAGRTRLAISTVLAVGGGGVTGLRVTPGTPDIEGLAVVTGPMARRASVAPPYPAVPPITRAVSAAIAITDAERGRRRPVGPAGKIAAVVADLSPPGGPPVWTGSPLGGAQVDDPNVGMGSYVAGGLEAVRGGSPKGPK